MLRLSTLSLWAACALCQAGEPPRGALSIMGDGPSAERFEPGGFSHFLIRNPTSAPAKLRVDLLGPQGWRFEATTCPRELGPGKACQIIVQWNPQGAESEPRAVLRASTAEGRAILPLFGDGNPRSLNGRAL